MQIEKLLRNAGDTVKTVKELSSSEVYLIPLLINFKGLIEG